MVCAGLPGDPVDEVAKAIIRRGGQAISFEGDVGNPESAEECVKIARGFFKRVDILVNNAGVAIVGDLTEKVSDEAFFRTVHNNINSVFYMTRAALPELKKTRGVILATGSIAGLQGEPSDAIYGGTKGFIHSFIQGLAVEQAPHGIRANCVLPGAIDTAMTRAGRSPISKQEEKTMVEGIPMRRKGTPEEIANAFAFLASDMATYVNGTLFVVDGAYTLTSGEAEEVPSRLRKKPKGALDGILKYSTQGGFKKNNPEPRVRN